MIEYNQEYMMIKTDNDIIRLTHWENRLFYPLYYFQDVKLLKKEDIYYFVYKKEYDSKNKNCVAAIHRLLSALRKKIKGIYRIRYIRNMGYILEEV